MCFIILQYFKNIIIFDFIIIFEKFGNNYVNELLIYNIKSKHKIVINNNIWKYNSSTSYCFHETKDDYFIYRVGGESNETIPNIKYSIRDDNNIALPFTQTPI